MHSGYWCAHERKAWPEENWPSGFKFSQTRFQCNRTSLLPQAWWFGIVKVGLLLTRLTVEKLVRNTFVFSNTAFDV